MSTGWPASRLSEMTLPSSHTLEIGRANCSRPSNSFTVTSTPSRCGSRASVLPLTRSRTTSVTWALPSTTSPWLR